MSSAIIQKVFAQEARIAARADQKKKQLHASLSRLESDLKNKEVADVQKAHDAARKKVAAAIEQADAEIKKMRKEYEKKIAQLHESFAEQKDKLVRKISEQP